MIAQGYNADSSSVLVMEGYNLKSNTSTCSSIAAMTELSVGSVAGIGYYVNNPTPAKSFLISLVCFGKGPKSDD